MSKILLASASPMRKNILSRLVGNSFDTMSLDVDETFLSGESAKDATLRLANLKLDTLLKLEQAKNYRYIICADTLIELDGKPCGKIESVNQLKNILKKYSGSSHNVFTSIAMYTNNKILCRTCQTKLFVKNLTDNEIDWYIAKNDWQGVAGGYKIQSFFGAFVEKIEGSYSNIEGLDLYSLYLLLQEAGYLFSYHPPHK